MGFSDFIDSIVSGFRRISLSAIVNALLLPGLTFGTLMLANRYLTWVPAFPINAYVLVFFSAAFLLVDFILMEPIRNIILNPILHLK